MNCYKEAGNKIQRLTSYLWSSGGTIFFQNTQAFSKSFKKLSTENKFAMPKTHLMDSKIM